MSSAITPVSVTHTSRYDLEEVTAAVRRHFELLGISGEIRPGMKVLLKPNLLMKRRPEEATTTHPVVVEAVVACLRELGIKDIRIADSPGGPYTKSALSAIYEASGLRDAAKRCGAELNYDCGSFERETADGVMLKRFTLINPLEWADYIINLPKLKTHGMMALSGGVKNLFGAIPGLMKPEFHWRFPENDRFAAMLLDLCETVKPNLTLCDGIIGMEGDGPSGGAPRSAGMIIASKSPYCLDVALCKVMSLDTSGVPTVRLGIERGFSPESAAGLELLGDELIRIPDFRPPKSGSVNFSLRLPKPLRPLADRLLISRPKIRRRDCIGCGKCAESCPAKTIRVADRKARIHYDNCIRCFCCHEMCPVKAIDIRRFSLFNL